MGPGADAAARVRAVSTILEQPEDAVAERSIAGGGFGAFSVRLFSPTGALSFLAVIELEARSICCESTSADVYRGMIQSRFPSLIYTGKICVML